MENLYRLEFNEDQQNFHLENNGKRRAAEPNTHGWFTIFEHCTDLEFEIFEAFVNRVPQKKLTKVYLLKCAKEVKAFMNNLLEYGILIKKNV